MNCWKKFWKIRKQNDAVKLLLLFLIIGIAFFINVLYNGFLLYDLVHNSAEYVLTDNTRSDVANSKIKNLRNLKQIIAVSRQEEFSLQVKGKNEELAFSCIELSQEYIEKVYGVKEAGAMKVFYMNQKAYSQLEQEFGKMTAKNGNEEQRELQIRYFAEEQSGEGELVQKEKSAKVVLIKEGVPNDKAFVFCKGGSLGSQVRICIGQQDMDGGILEQLEKDGFVVENMEEVMEIEFKKEMIQIKMGYGLGVSFVCIICAWVLWKIWNQRQKVM